MAPSQTPTLDELLEETGWDIEKIAKGDKNNPRYKILRDLQGNILSDHGRDYAVLIALRFHKNKVREVKKWISKLPITSALEQKQHAQARETSPYQKFFGFFLSAEGYRYLGLQDPMPNDNRFIQGMKASKVWLEDPDSRHWEGRYGRPIHAMLLIASDDPSKNYPWKDSTRVPVILGRDQERYWLEDQNRGVKHIAEVIAYERGWNYYDFPYSANKDKMPLEHFGYVDGISNPQFLAHEIKKSKEREAMNLSDRFQQYDPSTPLKFVLAHDPRGGQYSCGSFLVYRKLEQNVKRAITLAQRIANKYFERDRELVGAFTLGRFRDGTPIVVTDQRDSKRRHNDFNYNEDPYGSRCPFHGHTRQANSRDPREQHRRIARRGIPYGKRDATTKPPQEIQNAELVFQTFPERNVGLLFMCFQSSIENQFEWIQRRFNRSTEDGVRGPGVDPIVGKPIEKPDQKWPIKWGVAKFHEDEIDFFGCVTLKGGEYFFAPSISFLKNIADL